MEKGIDRKGQVKATRDMETTLGLLAQELRKKRRVQESKDLVTFGYQSLNSRSFNIRFAGKACRIHSKIV